MYVYVNHMVRIRTLSNDVYVVRIQHVRIRQPGGYVYEVRIMDVYVKPILRIGTVNTTYTYNVCMYSM